MSRGRERTLRVAMGALCVLFAVVVASAWWILLGPSGDTTVDGGRHIGGRVGSSTTARSTTSATTSTTVPTLYVPEDHGWSRVVFWDGFDTSRRDSRWKTRKGPGAPGSGQLQCYTPSNVGWADGALTETALRQDVDCSGTPFRYTSGAVTTGAGEQWYPLQSYVEVRARLPRGQGIAPWVRLRHRAGTEVAQVDVLDYLHASAPDATKASVHLDGTKDSGHSGVLPDPAAEWHTWAVAIEIAPGGVHFTFLTDGMVSHEYTDPSPQWPAAAPADATWDLAIGLAVGGTKVGSPDDPLGVNNLLARCAQAGTYPNGCVATGIQPATFPATFAVDYVRVLTR